MCCSLSDFSRIASLILLHRFSVILISLPCSLFQSDILWSGSDSDDEEEANVNFVEMWKSRSSSPMKLPDWNPRKSVEDYKKKVGAIFELFTLMMLTGVEK